MINKAKAKKVLVIGSTPSDSDSSANVDYGTAQIILSLKEIGYEVILVDSNPTALATNKDRADKVYIEPLTVDFVSQIIRKERPNEIFPVLHNSLSFYLMEELAHSGLLEELHIKVLGTSQQTIQKIKQPETFRKWMQTLKEPTRAGQSVYSQTEALGFAEKEGFPLVIQSQTPTGEWVQEWCSTNEKVKKVAAAHFLLSPHTPIFIETGLTGYKLIQFEVLRDKKDQALVVSTSENLKTDESDQKTMIMITPSQTLTDLDYQLLRDAALTIVRGLEIEGGCTIQFAFHPNRFMYYVTKIDPGFTRSTLLVSKATGYPIIKLAVKLAAGLTLDTLKNPFNETAYLEYEPTLDYITTYISNWSNGTSVKRNSPKKQITGEAMAIGRTLEESILKAFRSLDTADGVTLLKTATHSNDEEIAEHLLHAQYDHLAYLLEALRRGYTIEELSEVTKIELFFLDKLAHIIEIEHELERHPSDLTALRSAKEYGFSDSVIAALWKTTADEVNRLRNAHDIVPVYKAIDSSAGEIASQSTCFYSTYEEENESTAIGKKSILLLTASTGMNDPRRGYDSALLQAITAIQEAGYEAILLNSHPASLSTDFSVQAKTYLVPSTVEDIVQVVQLEKPIGVMVQFGGPEALELSKALTPLEIPVLDAVPSYLVSKEAENDGMIELIQPLLAELAIPYAALENQAMADEQIEVISISDGERVLFPGLIEHIGHLNGVGTEPVMVHPTQTLSEQKQQKIKEYATRLALALKWTGITTMYFTIQQENIQFLNLTLGTTQTIPFLSKATGFPIIPTAVQVLLGNSLAAQLDLKENTQTISPAVYVKAPVYSFSSEPEIDWMGEVMGSDRTLGKAIFKTFEAAQVHLSEFGSILLLLSEKDQDQAEELTRRFQQIGYRMLTTQPLSQQLAEKGLVVTALDPSFESIDKSSAKRINKKEIQLVIDTRASKTKTVKEQLTIRQAAHEQNIPLLTSITTISAVLNFLELRTFTTNPI
ncbi:MAG: carbamoyl-phosphate synthase large subunit [Carnobacterium sp.]|uniref:ATP-binding protein n=1 Tax=Carnobacterium sp. TaxID=48221 RepID=UPI002FCAD2EB